MITMNHIDPNMVPQRSGNVAADLAQIYHYLYQLAGDLYYRLQRIEGLLKDTGDGELRQRLEECAEQIRQLEQAPFEIPFGQVDQGSTATVMMATVPGVTRLEDGVCAYITNGVITSASGWTMNVNGLGAKPVYSSMAAATRTTTVFNVSYTMLFVYNADRVEGGCWDIYYGYDSNTNTIGYQLRTNSTTLPMKAATVRYRLLFTAADGTGWVPATTSTSTNATSKRDVCQTPINPFGRIVYYGTTAAVAVGAKPAAAYLWSQYVVTLGYSFNRTGAALVLTNPAPVYVRCTPQADGSAVMDPDTPYVQALPDSADGKIYIYLGTAVSATTVEVVPEHPVYVYRDGGVRLWTGA